jgi:hypothetical protein
VLGAENAMRSEKVNKILGFTAHIQGVVYK